MTRSEIDFGKRQRARRCWSVRYERLAERRDCRWCRMEEAEGRADVSLSRRSLASRHHVMEGLTTVVHNRCVETGNGRSVRRWFRQSGRTVREKARRGRLGGVYRVSW